MYYKLLSFLTLLLFTACKTTESNERTIDFSVDRDFRIINVFNEQKYSDYQNRLPENIKPNKESEDTYTYYSYLSLRSNKDFTFLIGNKFMYGTYKLLNNDEIILHSKEFGDIPLKIIDEAKGCIQVIGDFKDYKSDMMLELDGKTTYYLNLNTDFEKLNKENDIRSVEFNDWRFKPEARESKEEIRIRLIKNLKYISAYMRVHMYGGFDSIHTDGIHSPFSYARNALILLEWQRVSYFWKHIFYDEKDADKAYFMIKRAIESSEAPVFVDDWLDYNEKCLQTIIDKLEEE